MQRGKGILQRERTKHPRTEAGSQQARAGHVAATPQAAQKTRRGEIPKRPAPERVLFAPEGERNAERNERKAPPNTQGGKGARLPSDCSSANEMRGEYVAFRGFFIKYVEMTLVNSMIWVSRVQLCMSPVCCTRARRPKPSLLLSPCIGPPSTP